MEIKQARWAVIGLIGGVIYPIVHAMLTVTFFDFLAIQIIILRVCIFFAMVILIAVAVKYASWAKAKGLLKEQKPRGYSKFAAQQAAMGTFVFYLPIIACLVVVLGLGFSYVPSIPRSDMIGFASGAFGIGYWLVIGGILVPFTYFVLKPIIKTLKPEEPTKIPRMKAEKGSAALQQITTPESRPAKPIDKQELLQFLSSNTGEEVKCPACGSTNPAGTKTCRYCRNPL